MQEREIFEKALEILDPDEREAFLDQVCGTDQTLRTRLKALMASHESASGFLNVPVFDQISPANAPEIRTTIESRRSVPLVDDGDRVDRENNGNMQFDLSFLEPSARPESVGVLGHYEVLRVLGQGAFGIVLLAIDEKLQRQVAIKVINPRLAATSPPRKRFLREARSAAATTHENVVQVYSVEEQPLPYIVMEYINGQTLQEKLDARGPLKVPEILHLGRQMARGLAAAHSHGLIHRDIKPGNILLEHGADPKVKITDFGLARAADDASMTQTGVIAGTPMYMAPEQAQGGPLDSRTDLFSLGSVLYQMTSGRPPFRASTAMAVLKRVTEESPRPIQEIIPEVPDWLCAIIAKLHAKRPEDRFSTADEVGDLLDRCLNDLQNDRPVQLPNELQLYQVNSVTAEEQKFPARPSQAVSPTPPTNSRHHWGTFAAIVLVLIAGVGLSEVTGMTEWTSTVIRLASSSGTLVIETDDPNVKVTIDGEVVQIQGAGIEQLTLKPGQYQVAAVKDGEPISQQLVTITRGGREVVRVTRERTSSTNPTVGTSSTEAMDSERASVSDPFPQIAVDLSPPERLGTWEMGPEPPWFRGERLRILTSDILPGLIERPAKLPGIKRWNVDTVWSRGRVTVAQYSPDGKWLATGSHDGHVRIYAADSMELISLLPGTSMEHGVLDLSWHPSSDRLAVAADGNGYAFALRIWSRTGQLLFEESTDFYGSVAWSHSGEWIAEGSITRIVLRRADGTQEKVLAEGKLASVYRGGSIVWSPDDQKIACRHYDGTLRLWNIATGESEALAELTVQHFGYGLAWGKAGWLAATDGVNLRLFHPERNETRTIAFEDGYGPSRVAWHPDGLRGISTERWNRVFTWGCDDERPTVLGRVLSSANTLAISPDGKRVTFADSALQVYDSELKQVLFQTPTTLLAASDLAWSADGEQLAGISAFADGVALWSPAGRRTGTIAVTYNGGRLKSGPGGKWLLFGGNSPGAWLIEPSQTPRKLLQVNSTSADWSSDGKHFAVGTVDGTVIIFNHRGEITHEMSAGTGITQLAWSGVTNLLAVHCGQRLFICDPTLGWKLTPGTESTHPARKLVDPIWTPSGDRFSLLNDGWFDQQGNRIADTSAPYILEWRPDGKRYLGEWAASYLPSGTLVDRRTFNGLTYGEQNVPRFHPRGNLLVAGYWQSAIMALRDVDMQPHWHAVLLPERQSATFSAAGKLLDGDQDTVETYLVYYLERDDGRTEILKPSEFQ